MRTLFAAISVLALAACDLNGTDRYKEEGQNTAPTEQAEADNLADSMASNDTRDGQSSTQATIPDSEKRPMMQAQVVLDRRGFGPGVIDGKMGQSTENALRGFQEANDLTVTGELDEPTKLALARWDNIPATRVVTIPANWGRISYTDIPEEPAEQAKLDRLGYESLDEKLAERFHTTVDVLKRLNPNGRPAGMTAANQRGNGAQSETDGNAPSRTSSQGNGSKTESYFRAGQQLRVPNIGADRIAPGAVSDKGWQQTLAALGVGTEQPDVARIVVSESAGTLRAFDAQDNLVALFTVTTGSTNDPLPIGEWKINGVGHNPEFSYDPDLFWDVPDSEEDQQLPPGPNGPVGVVWIDLTKEHYGIHGTPEPQTIGRTQSHGCVRLTNWDAARLAEMVSTDTQVIFES